MLNQNKLTKMQWSPLNGQLLEGIACHLLAAPVCAVRNPLLAVSTSEEEEEGYAAEVSARARTRTLSNSIASSECWAWAERVACCPLEPANRASPANA